MSVATTELVSTIIPVYNRPKMLREAVQSVLNQTHPSIEIIIVDDGSTDNTWEVCTALARERPAIVKIIQQPNGGAGLARETGRQLATGEFIQYLDSDDLLHPTKFEVQVAALREHPDCGAAYCFTRYYRIGNTPENVPWKGTGRTVDALFPLILDDRWWDTPNPLYRAEVCQAAGPWTDLRWEEDWEYDCRIGALGTRLVHCKQFLVDVRDHTDGRLSKGSVYDPQRLRCRAKSHTLIYHHARRAGIDHEHSSMKRFARKLFLLARQCGVAGLSMEAKQLFELAREASGPTRCHSTDFRVYSTLAKLLGWPLTGRIACAIDPWFGYARKRLGRNRPILSEPEPSD